MNKAVTLIGGGTSIGQYELPDSDFCAINICTLALPLKYTFYQDERILEHLRGELIKVTDFKIPKGHTGFMALYFVARFMKYDIIYLAGYDYYDIPADEDGLPKSHYFGEQYHSDTPMYNSYRMNPKAYYKNHLDEFNNVEWGDYNIFNLNVRSKLKINGH